MKINNEEVFIVSRFMEKGYFVKENAPVYLTLDMDRTAKWFEEVLYATCRYKMFFRKN